MEDKHRRVDFTKALKRYIPFLDFVTLFTILALLFVSARLKYEFLDYIPPHLIAIILFFVAVLVGGCLYLAKLISKSAINEISERKRAEEINRQQLGRLKVLSSVERAVNSSLELQVTLDVLLSEVTSQLNIDAASILLLNQQTQTLNYVVSKGFRSSALKYTQLKLGESNAGRAAMEKRIITIPNLKEETSGFEHSKLFHGEDFVTYIAVPLIAKGELKGVLELFHRSHLGSDSEWLEFLETIANEASIAIDNATLYEGLQSSNLELSLAYDSTIEGWARALELRDKETEGHTRRVAEITLSIARGMGVEDDELVHIKRGALLHDMGKMGIPDSILLKPGPLSEQEWETMKLHPVLAYEMLYPIEYLRPAMEIPHCHHEKWDGTGYPTGLKGDKIPFSARIFAVVDVWDALCSDRPYRSGWPKDKVHGHILSHTNTHFDPEVVKVFSKMGL
jgi:HD-GYP domain-containing protein (c-di-GMP phosphodiesterase class II)